MAKETISHAVYDGRELAGAIEALEHGGFIALDTAGKRLGAFQPRLAAVRAVLDAARKTAIEPDTEAELIEAIEASMKESNQ